MASGCHEWDEPPSISGRMDLFHFAPQALNPADAAAPKNCLTPIFIPICPQTHTQVRTHARADTHMRACKRAYFANAPFCSWASANS